jgi:TRAP-type uncharacterized transport system fused permease subunit
MTLPTKPPGAESGRAWPKWIFWTFAAVALLLLVLEHRAHAIGWWLHALTALCIVVLYLAVRTYGDGPRNGGPR